LGAGIVSVQDEEERPRGTKDPKKDHKKTGTLDERGWNSDKFFKRFRKGQLQGRFGCPTRRKKRKAVD